LLSQIVGQLGAGLAGGARNLDPAQLGHVARGVGAAAGGQPLLQPAEEVVIGEVFAPQRGVGDTGFGQRAVEIEHAHEPGPGARPVGHRKDRAAVGHQAREDVVGVLPDRLGHNQRRVGVEIGEDRHAFFLRLDKAVAAFRVVVVGPFKGVAKRGEHVGELRLHLRLGFPTGAVGGEAQVAVDDQRDGFRSFFGS